MVLKNKYSLKKEVKELKSLINLHILKHEDIENQEIIGNKYKIKSTYEGGIVDTIIIKINNSGNYSLNGIIGDVICRTSDKYELNECIINIISKK